MKLIVWTFQKLNHFSNLLTDACYLPGYSGGPYYDSSYTDKTIDECFSDCVEHGLCLLATYTETFDGSHECKFYNNEESLFSQDDKKSISIDLACTAHGHGKMLCLHARP